MNPDIQTYFDQITGAVERILAAGAGMNSEMLNQSPVPGEANSIYVLSTHIMGNLRQGIVSLFGGAEDNRDRDSEFVARGDSIDDLNAAWAELKPRIHATMSKLTPEILEQPMEHPRRGPMNGWAILLNTATHAAEHAGHAELTRQILMSAHSGARGGIEQ